MKIRTITATILVLMWPSISHSQETTEPAQREKTPFEVQLGEIFKDIYTPKWSEKEALERIKPIIPENPEWQDYVAYTWCQGDAEAHFLTVLIFCNKWKLVDFFLAQGARPKFAELAGNTPNWGQPFRPTENQLLKLSKYGLKAKYEFAEPEIQAAIRACNHPFLSFLKKGNRLSKFSPEEKKTGIEITEANVKSWKESGIGSGPCFGAQTYCPDAKVCKVTGKLIKEKF